MTFFPLLQKALIECSQESLEVKASALFGSLLLGLNLDRAAELQSQIKVTGTLYFFVISGLHISILAQAVVQLFIAMRIPKSLHKGLSFLVLGMYGGLIGFSIPVLRTVSMRFHSVISAFLKRSTSAQYVFFLSVILVGLLAFFQTEKTVSSISFQLSYGAVAGILFLLPKENFTKKSTGFSRVVTSFIRKNISTSVAINMLLVPLLLHYFGSWSPLSIVFSVVLSPLITLVGVLGFGFLAWELVSLGLSLRSEYLLKVFAGVFQVCVDMLVFLLDWFAGISWQFSADFSVTFLVLYYFCLVGVVVLFKYVKKVSFSPFL